MKRINEKIFLFLVATFTVFYGITDNLLKATEARVEDVLAMDMVMLDFDDVGLSNIIYGDYEIYFDPEVYTYSLKVNELSNLSILPVLVNDSTKYTVDIIGDVNVDKIVNVVITVGLENTKKYIIFVEEVDK